ncbi:MAG: NAD(P)-dependent oxidoreductase [Isosphaeraceae bacterium]
MRAVVIGGSGQIGGWLLRWLAERGHESVGTYATSPFEGLHFLDSADLSAAADWLRARKPDVVFYPAGFTWVDGCERDPAKARAANLEQPLNLAKAAAENAARFVYFSSDYVFDGVAGPYDESATPVPLSAYGQAKRDAELALAEALGDLALTLRATWVFGPERQGKNFAYQLARTLSRGETLVCPSDQTSSPTYGPDIARAAVLLAERKTSGVVHVAGPEIMDRVTFARRLAAAMDLDPSRIEGKTTAELGQGAPRPLNSGLLTPKLDAWLPGAMRPLAETLPEFVRLASGRDWAALRPKD